MTLACCLSTLSCGGAERPQMVFSVERGACDPGCAETRYEFLVLRAQFPFYCVITSEKGPAGSGSREAVVEGVLTEPAKELAFGVKVFCVDKPKCAVCVASGTYPLDAENRPRLMLKKSDGTCGVDDPVIGAITGQCK